MAVMLAAIGDGARSCHALRLRNEASKCWALPMNGWSAGSCLAFHPRRGEAVSMLLGSKLNRRIEDEKKTGKASNAISNGGC